ncbi:oxidoreductase [Jiangella anatolica]|uniref:Oxidoreductase n=2 Tax=Jiangella anatolica TaxID=2670374 RepID=A0A2W2CDE6_9ACTN|nr:oxidoreductase [Jiangella anatolica]
MVHLGVGAFHRAHQAWYTAHAAEPGEWGILGFTGRSRETADRLTSQDGLYTLVERGPDGDRFEVIGSIARAEPGERVDELAAALGRARTAVVTLTITEAGYRLGGDGTPDRTDPAVAADLRLLGEAIPAGADPAALRPVTVLGRLVAGLEARRRTGAGPIALVSCDNLPDNAGLLAGAIGTFADAASAELARWVSREVAYVATSVDRITPRSEPSLSEAVRDATGWLDVAPVVTEPFSDWVLAGEFPAGRPAWEEAAARFVARIEPWELRKLWLLNGAHSLLSFAGPLRGCRTVADAIADPWCRRAVERLWADGVRQLPSGLDLDRYRVQLMARFENPRIAHRLDQIAIDGLTKVRLRVVPVARRELATGGNALGCAQALGAWVASTLAGTVEPGATIGDLLGRVDADLARDGRFAARVESAVRTLLDRPLV